MRRGTPLLLAAAVAIAGCGGGLSMPDGGDTGIGCTEDVPLQRATGASCRFLVPLPACDDLDRAHIGVKVGGTEIVRDVTHASGWDYTDSTMELVDVYGPSCDLITANPAIPVSVVFKRLLP